MYCKILMCCSRTQGHTHRSAKKSPPCDCNLELETFTGGVSMGQLAKELRKWLAGSGEWRQGSNRAKHGHGRGPRRPIRRQMPMEGGHKAQGRVGVDSCTSTARRHPMQECRQGNNQNIYELGVEHELSESFFDRKILPAFSLFFF